MTRFGMTWATGSTITVLHDVGDDNNRKKEKAKAKERKPILAGRSDEASW